MPEEYRIVAVSDWFTVTRCLLLSPVVERVIKDSNSGESSKTVPYRREGILAAVSEVANATTGLLRWIWREISGLVLDGLEGETTTPKERREKWRIGMWRELGERMKAVSPLERWRRFWREEVRVWIRRAKSEKEMRRRVVASMRAAAMVGGGEELRSGKR